MFRRGLILLGALIMGVALAPEVAGAAPVHARGNMKATQNMFTHKITVRGWAYATDKRSVPVMVRVYIDGHYRGRTMTNQYNANVNKAHHLSGKHSYSITVRASSHRAHRVTTTSYGYRTHQHRSRLATRNIAHYYPKAGTRVVTVAKRYVGAPYTYGGSSPRSGFDCSGFTMYVYKKAHVRNLPHQSESQRHVHGMHRVSARHARPGDLVFYMDGGNAYHVAIYTGHHRQISAATTRSGVKAQKIWARNVQYGTVTH